MPRIDFVILAGPRTGSTYLVDYLASIPGVACLSELFLPDRPLFRHHDPIDPRLLDAAFRDAAPDRFLDLVRSEAAPQTHFGFKIIGSQNSDRLHALCRDRGSISPSFAPISARRGIGIRSAAEYHPLTYRV